MSGQGARRVTVLAGGVGGARFVRGMREALRRRGSTEPQDSLTVVVNTGDDLWLSGVRLQPDIDSIMYALAGINDTERGWGRAGESERVADELRAWGAGWPWFTLGDLDLGAHLARTGWLHEGLTVGQVVTRLTSRWPLGARLLPMTDAEVDTIVTVADGGGGASGTRTMHFQEWWTRHRAALPPLRFDNPGIEQASPSAGVVEAIEGADVVVVAPSNPVVSIGPILAVPGIRSALRATAAPVVGVSPIIGGRVVRGMADVCLAAIGVDTAADAVARHYGARGAGRASSGSSLVSSSAASPVSSSVSPGAGGILDAWLLADEDRALADSVERAGIRARVRPLWMDDLDASAAIAEAVLVEGERIAGS